MDRTDPLPETIFEAARLTVRLDAIQANYRQCQLLGGPAAVAGVVKADGYGLGAGAVARTLVEAGCDAFFVARIEEGIALRPLAPEARIYVLDGAPFATVPALINHRLTPVLNSLSEIANWREAARDARGQFDAAIHIDTGMNRLGLPPEELGVLAREAKTRLEGLRIVLAMSHLACADDPSAKMNAIQRDRFRSALAMLPPGAWQALPPRAAFFSAGIMCSTTWVRPGIGLYGGNPQTGRPNPFRTAAQLTGKILQLRRVDKGESVGYGATFRIERPTMLATVALGYADGLMRAIGNRGKAAIAGRMVPIAGRVSMDLITLDCKRRARDHQF